MTTQTALLLLIWLNTLVIVYGAGEDSCRAAEGGGEVTDLWKLGVLVGVLILGWLLVEEME